MFGITETSQVKQYRDTLRKRRKFDDLAKIDTTISYLEQFGSQILQTKKGKSYKLYTHAIIELKPTTQQRIFCLQRDNQFVLFYAFEKKSNKTENQDKENGLRELEEYLTKN